MLRPNCHITIGDLLFEFVNSLKIERTWENLTDTATIKLPRKLKLGKKSLKDVISKGDPVEIQLGYAPDLTVEFTGYVTEIEPNIPFMITCEDEMWQLKQKTFNKSWEKVKLSEVVNHIAGSYQSDVASTGLGPFRIKDASAAKVLKAIKDQYGLVSYFKNGTLVVGKTYIDDDQEVNYHFQQNVISNDLKYRSKEDAKVKVKAISMLPDGKKHEVEVGDDSGETTTLHFYDLSKSDLKDRAEEKLDELKVDGYKGSLTTFGVPYPDHGFTANLTDDKYPERSGSYFIDRVTTKYGIEGFRRTVELGPKAA